MATQTFLPAANDIGYKPAATAPEAAPAAILRELKNLRAVLVLAGLFAIAATIEALIPKLRFLLFQLPFFAVPALFATVLKYLREFHPAYAPALLSPSAPLLGRLRRARKILGWTALGTTLAGVAAMFATSQSCTCEEHPILFMGWLATDVLSCLGYAGVAAYIAARIYVAPVGIRSGSGNWTAARWRSSEFKPLHSEHWGRSTPR